MPVRRLQWAALALLDRWLSSSVGRPLPSDSRTARALRARRLTTIRQSKAIAPACANNEVWQRQFATAQRRPRLGSQQARKADRKAMNHPPRVPWGAFPDVIILAAEPVVKGHRARAVTVGSPVKPASPENCNPDASTS